MGGKDKVLNLFDKVIYAVFGLFLIYRSFVTTGNVVMKVVLALLGVFFVYLSYLFSRQKKLYDQAIHELNDMGDYEKAAATYEMIIRNDYLKIYTKQRYFFDMMVMMEAGEYEKVLWIIDMNEKQFDVNDDLKRIKLYYAIRANLKLGRHEEVKKCFHQLEKLSEDTGNIDSFYLKEARGIYEAANGNSAKALQSFQQIDLQKLCFIDKRRVLKELADYSSGSERKEYQRQYEALLKEKGAR